MSDTRASDLFDDEMADLEKEAATIVADPGLWLRTANVQLGGHSPMDLLSTPEGKQLVRDLIRAIKHGMVS